MESTNVESINQILVATIIHPWYFPILLGPWESNELVL